MDYPLIVLFDMDGTLIGDTKPLLFFFNFMSEIGMKYDVNCYLIKCLKRGLCRPYIKEFMDKIREYKNVEFFVYTSSSIERAYLLIQGIEEAFNITFNRPILTYEYTNNGHKSIKNIKKILLKFLKDKYDICTIESTLRRIIIIFDDNSHAFSDKKDERRVIIVPKYTRSYFKDIMYCINRDNYKIFIKNIINILNYTILEDDYDVFKKKYYELLYYYNSDENNINYWKDFDIDIIKNLYFK